MQIFNFSKYKEKLLNFWQDIAKKSDEDTIAAVGRERIIVFVICFVIALCMWLMVNLSKDYNLKINLPISLGAIPVDQALTESLPQKATVTVSGEGWKLINIYNNPPKINVDVKDDEVNLYDQVQRQMNTVSNVRVQKVQPLFLRLDLDKRDSKTIPVTTEVTVNFENGYYFLGSPHIQPDSVTVSGAASLLKNISQLPTDSVEINDVAGPISRKVPLKNENNLLSFSNQTVTYKAEVAQYTEGEAKVEIQTTGLPAGKKINYTPAAMVIKFKIPIEQYGQIKDKNIFEASVSYQQIKEDTTGSVIPEIQQVIKNGNLKMRSVQPSRVSYFMVLNE